MGEQTKQCSRCQVLLPLSAFHRRRHYVRAGVRAACKQCTARDSTPRPASTQAELKELVRARTRSAVTSGRLVRQACTDCGDPNTEAHHPDYEMPEAHLHVEWLCRLHHAARHGKHPWTRQLEFVEFR